MDVKNVPEQPKVEGSLFIVPENDRITIKNKYDFSHQEYGVRSLHTRCQRRNGKSRL